MKLIYKESYVDGMSAAHKMAFDLATDHDELEIKLGDPVRLFSSIPEMREFAKENQTRILSFSPPGVDFTSNDKSEEGFRFTFFAKGPNEGAAARKCAMIHACIIKGDTLKWKYLVAEFYDIGDVHRDHRKQIASPKHLYTPDENED